MNLKNNSRYLSIISTISSKPYHKCMEIQNHNQSWCNQVKDKYNVLWQPLITKTNDYTNGKSLSWISSGEFTRELDKESLLN